MLLHFVYLGCLFASSVAGFIYRKELKSRHLSLFPYFLFAVFAQEVLMYLYLRQHPSYSTGFVYNLYNPVNTTFFATFYYAIPFNYPVRKLIGSLLALFLMAVLITFCCIQSINTYNSYLSLAGGFLITVCAILFLFNYFKLDNHDEERRWRPVIWVTIGLVVFYPVVNISFALYKYLLAYQATVFGLRLYRVIPQLMSIFMYVCFIRAFYLCSKKKSTLSFR